jgi:DNA-directed RNA polymerase subunit RPC12/RpoP
VSCGEVLEYVMRVMPETPITLYVPESCPHCGVRGLVKMQKTVSGNRVLLGWLCDACGHEWLVHHKDAHPARP